MKPKYYDNIINGVKGRLWPNVLICHGYRDSKNFWFAKTPRLIPELLPIRNASLSSVRYAADPRPVFAVGLNVSQDRRTIESYEVVACKSDAPAGSA